jgi:hypothetical protein
MNRKLPYYFTWIAVFIIVFIFSVYPANAALPFRTIKIMPLGDSITYGYTDGSLTNDTTVGYRQKLYLDLVKLGYKINFVGSLMSGELVTPSFDYDHEGWPRYTVEQIADNIFNWLLDNPADIVLLHIGTNDLDPDDPEDDPDVEQILNEIDRYSLDVIVILARIINRKTYSQRTTTFNNNIEDMALRRIANGDKIVIVDMESALDYATDMADLKHPNEVGYEKMADVWLDALLDVMPFDAIGTFRKGAWYLDRNLNDRWDSNDIAIPVYSFGSPGDTPVTGDWDGSGFTSIGVFRKGAWYLDYNGTNKWDAGDKTASFGISTDIPVTGDWNGDGKTSIGVFRKGAWYLDYNGTNRWDAGDKTFSFGVSTDLPVTGDWNGDGKTNLGVFRKGAWYLDYNGNGMWDSGDKTIEVGKFGSPGDVPVTGDWNGDGKTNLGIFRKGAWYLDYNGNNSWDSGDIAIPAGLFGAPDDIPIAGLW